MYDVRSVRKFGVIVRTDQGPFAVTEGPSVNRTMDVLCILSFVSVPGETKLNMGVHSEVVGQVNHRHCWH